jgi:hypothetical protein
MLKTVMEGATLIGVAVAVLAGSFYAVGTIAYLSYFKGLGFDAHQFPALGFELQVTGFTYSLLPALALGVVVLFFAWLFVITKDFGLWSERGLAWWQRTIDAWLSRHPVLPKGLMWLIRFVLIRALPALLIFALLTTLLRLAGVVDAWAVLSQDTPKVIAGSLIVMAMSWRGGWVLNVALYCITFVLTISLVLPLVSNQASKDGQARAVQVATYSIPRSWRRKI